MTRDEQDTRPRAFLCNCKYQLVLGWNDKQCFHNHSSTCCAQQLEMNQRREKTSTKTSPRPVRGQPLPKKFALLHPWKAHDSYDGNCVQILWWNHMVLASTVACIYRVPPTHLHRENNCPLFIIKNAFPESHLSSALCLLRLALRLTLIPSQYSALSPEIWSTASHSIS
jgi:hypothetical protein